MFDIFDILEEARKEGITPERFCKKFGGFTIYIPKVRPDYEERVLEEFNGYNKDFLAYKYNVTPRTISEVISKYKKKGLINP